MEPSRLHCVLVIRDGPSRRVGAAGVVIGRQRDCDLVTTDPSASRRHALVRLTVDGAEVVPLGKEPVIVNGKVKDRPSLVADGDTIAVPGLVVEVQIEAAAPIGAAGFVLARTRGGRFGIAHTPFSIGGGATDDLIVKKWPAATLRLSIAQGELFVEVRVGSAEKNGAILEVGALEPLVAGDRLACRGEELVVHAEHAAATTAVSAHAELPVRVEIELLPRGGRIVFALPTGDRAVYLADRRFDLMMALLRPPVGYRAGEPVPDEVVRGVVWPRKAGGGRSELNMLISRCRRDLVDAGLAGPRLLERTGGATRFCLAASVAIAMKT